MKKEAFLLAALVLIAGCSDNSAGVGAGSSSANTSDSSSTLSKSKAISAANESAKSIQMPAIAIISEAFTERVPGHQNDNSRMQDAGEGNQEEANNIRELGPLIFEMKSRPAEYDKEFKGKLSPRLEKQFADSTSGTDISNALIRFRMERRIASCTSPMNGWEYLPTKKDSGIYMQAIANACDFANVIYTELAGKIGARALENPAEAVQEVLKNWDSIPLETVENTWREIAKKSKGATYSANLTGVKGVQFTGPGGMYWNQGGGFAIVKNSAKWFGEGAISGKVIDFNLRSSLGTKTEKSKTLSNSEAQQSGGKTGADIGIK